MNHQSINERNKAVKKLLVATYGGVNISVRAGTGTARHWIHIEFMRMPEELRSCKNGLERASRVQALIEAAGIFIHTYSSDGDYTGKCIETTVRGVPWNV
jgi:hypothetical protein